MGSHLNQAAIIKALEEEPISECPMIKECNNNMIFASCAVEAGSLYLLYNSHGASRVFYKGELPDNLDAVRFVVVCAKSIPEILADSEANHYIPHEVYGKELRDLCIDYANEKIKLSQEQRPNVHLLLF